MSNNLNLYDPLFYAQEALIQLEKTLGIAARIHRGYDKSPQRKGSTIKINRPGTFSAQDEPSTAQDLNPEDVEITLAYWRGVKFKLTDRELTFTTDQIINDHIRPAAVAIADDIDSKLSLLVNDVPWYVDETATPTPNDMVNVNKMLFDNRVPVSDESQMHMMINSATYAAYLKDALFQQAQQSNTGAGDVQMRGTIGRKFGFEIFRNSNITTHTAGTCSLTSLTVTAALAVGAETIGFSSGSPAVTGTLLAGDTFIIAGSTQRYAVTNSSAVTASGGAFAGVTFTPALKVAVSGGEVVTINLDSHTMMVGFHHNAFALAMAPLSTVGDGLGAKMESVSDPLSNLSLRSRIWYDGATSSVYVGLDALYGIKCLDPNLGVRLRGAV